MAAGISTVTTTPVSAATSECGPGCISIFSSELGVYGDENFVEAVLGDGTARVGQPVGLKPESGTDPSQDFLPGGAPGVTGRASKVSDFFADGLVSAEANSRFGHLNAVQQMYAPSGKVSGMCVGVSRVAQGEDLILQPCDLPGRTVWIVYPAPGGPSPAYFAIVNAATTDFDRPFAMHLPRREVTSSDLELQMELRRLQYRTGDQVLPARQLWGAAFGPQA